MRCLWETQSDLHWERNLIELLETSRNFFVTSLKRLKYISKKMSFDAFKTSRAYLKRDIFSKTSLRRRKNISRKCLWFLKNTPEKWFCVIFKGLLDYLIK